MGAGGKGIAVNPRKVTARQETAPTLNAIAVKAKTKRQKPKTKRQKAKTKRQKAKTKR